MVGVDFALSFGGEIESPTPGSKDFAIIKSVIDNHPTVWALIQFQWPIQTKTWHTIIFYITKCTTQTFRMYAVEVVKIHNHITLTSPPERSYTDSPAK